MIFVSNIDATPNRLRIRFLSLFATMEGRNDGKLVCDNKKSRFSIDGRTFSNFTNIGKNIEKS